VIKKAVLYSKQVICQLVVVVVAVTVVVVTVTVASISVEHIYSRPVAFAVNYVWALQTDNILIFITGQ